MLENCTVEGPSRALTLPQIIVTAGEVLGGFRVAIVISGQLLPIGAPPPRLTNSPRVAIGHVVCRISIKATEPDVVVAIQQDPARFIEEIFGKTLVEGVNAGTHTDLLLFPFSKGTHSKQWRIFALLQTVLHGRLAVCLF